MLLNGCIRSCTHASRSPGFLSIFLRCTFTYAIHTNISFYKLTKSAMYISNVIVLGWLAFFINCLTVTNNIVSKTNAIPKSLDFNTNISTIKCKYQKESSLNLMKKPTDILTRQQEFFFVRKIVYKVLFARVESAQIQYLLPFGKFGAKRITNYMNRA